MNRFLTTLLLAGAATSLSFQATAADLPYTSDMATQQGINSDWTPVWSNNKAKRWEYDRNNTGTLLATPGTSNAVAKFWDDELTADCWLISPEFELKEGKVYTVSVWAKTRDADPEKFKICYGTAAEVSAMTNVLIQETFFKSPDDYRKLTASITPDADMTVHVGIHCFSDPSCYDLSMTGFSIYEEGSEPVPDDPITPPDEEGLALPVTFTFDNNQTFMKDWVSGYGPETSKQEPWQCNTYSKWIYFDEAEGAEDNWVISPLLNFAEAGSYQVTYTGLITGKLEFLLGTGTEDLTDYTVIGTKEVYDSSDNDAEYDMYFNVEEAGNYRVAVRACAETGTYMGYRMKKLRVRQDNALPAAVNDLRAVPDLMDGLSVALTWTNPATDEKGEALSEITKIELYRDGVMIKDDFITLTPGGANAWLDDVEAAGIYTYQVKVYNSNGAADVEPKKVKTSYVGHPTADMPYSANSSYETDMSLFTCVDANEDGVNWEFYKGASSWYNTMKLEPTSLCELDDYLISPYLHLEPGYYEFNFTVSCNRNSFEAGYVTNRHDPAGTFVKLFEIHNWDGYYAPDGREIFAIAEEGDYALCIHAIGTSSSGSYLKLELASMSLTATQMVPLAITDLTATEVESEEGEVSVVLNWKNPTMSNAKTELEGDLTITIKRNDTEVATLTVEPGSDGTWEDPIETAGNYTYTVTVSNANGPAEGRAPQVSLYAGPSLQLPYETTDFSSWLIEDKYNCWEINADGHAIWDPWYAWNTNLSVFTPFVVLEDGAEYVMEATFDGNPDGTQGMKVVSSTVLSEDSALEHHNFTLPEAAADHTVNFMLAASSAATPALLAEEGEAEEEEEAPVEESEKINVPAGKIILGFRPSESGTVKLKSFKLSKANETGIGSTIVAEGNGIVYAGGVASCAGATELQVSDLSGRVLRAVKGESLDLNDLREGTGKVVIISAPGNKSLKVVL